MNEHVESILRHYNADPAKFAPELPGVLTGDVDGPGATDLWLALRDAFAQTSIWPVIRGMRDYHENIPVDAPAILAASKKAGSLREILSFKLGEQRSFATDVMGLAIPPDTDAVALGQLLDASGAFGFGARKSKPAPWPTELPAPKIEFVSTHEIGSRKPSPTVELSLIALQNPWEAPAYLGFGGWNDCPAPEIQVAALHDWFDRFGAVPAVMTADVMECVVGRPPMTEPESLALAADQWLFCDDIVSQGCMSIHRLGIELWRSPKWYFWWD
jgi:hypothetical protein